MKFNIKNTPGEPDIINLGELEALRSYNYRSQKWFEGFEKEIREKLEFEENQAKKPDREQSMVAHFQIDLIKEILGA